MSVAKLSTETTADPVKEDDQVSDFGDFEEDDPRPKKRWILNETIFLHGYHSLVNRYCK